MKLTITTKRLELKHTWRIARGAVDSKEYNFVTLERDGISGHGEAAHNTRYDESTESIRSFLEQARPLLESANPWHFRDLGREIQVLANGQQAGKAALDMALIDWVCRALNVPYHRYLGLDPEKMPATSYSIGIDKPEQMQERIRDAAAFRVLKIKLGSDNDEAIMRAVREATDRPVRVDANEGWRQKEQALARIHQLAEQQVEFVEQPMPAGRLLDVAWLRQHSPLPLIADEDVRSAADIPRLAGVYHGINIKVMKAGGLQEALRMIELARTFGLKIMLGCMIESSLGISAAAQLAPLVDWIDLDGNLLIANDPYRGVRIEQGRPVLPATAGVGAEPAGE